MAKIDFERYNRNKKVWNSSSSYSGKPNIKPKFIKMKSKYKSTCEVCLKQIKINSTIKYFPEYKTAIHYNCKNLV